MINSMIKIHLKWWMNTNQFVQGMSIHPSDPKTFPFSDTSHYGWEFIWNDESFLSWLRVGRPILAPYQHVGNNGHSFHTDKKKVREKSRECHNHKPQPFPDPKRKRKPTNLNKHKLNKRMKSTKISSLFPKRGNRNT